MKVLHVLRQLNPGGIECWLDRLTQNWQATDRPQFHCALEEAEFGSLAPSFARSGVFLHHCPAPRQTYSSARGFLNILDTYGPFDAVHCHNHHASAYHLALAKLRQVRLLISHSHADYRNRAFSPVRNAYRQGSRRMLNHLGAVKLAVGKGAALDLFGKYDDSVELLPCGIDFSTLLATQRNPDPSCFTLVHVGRLVPEKNHQFLFLLMKELLIKEPRSRLWLIGDGPERASLERLALDLGISQRVEFFGNRNDVAMFLAQSDVLVFPSHSEGLGSVAIEAQAAGLPVLLAAHLPPELDLFPELCRRLALNLPLECWMNSILEIKDLPSVPSDVRARRLADSPYSLSSNISALRRIYGL